MDPWEDPRVLAGLTRQLSARSSALAGGTEPIGWKVGFGSPSSLELMEITAPLIGYLTSATLMPSGASIDPSTWARGVVEFEVAVRMGHDLGPGAGHDQAAAAVSALAPAIELADVTIVPAPDRVSDIVGENIFHTGLVLGDFDAGRAGLDLEGLVGHITIDGVERDPVHDLEAITGRYPRIVSTVATTLAASGERLRSGDIIITGAIVPPVPIGEGSRFTFTLGDSTPVSVINSSAPSD